MKNTNNVTISVTNYTLKALDLWLLLQHYLHIFLITFVILKCSLPMYVCRERKDLHGGSERVKDIWLYSIRLTFNRDQLLHSFAKFIEFFVNLQKTPLHIVSPIQWQCGKGCYFYEFN